MIGLPGIVRAKLLVATYGRQFVIILFVVGVLLMGSAGWIYTHPPTTTVTDNTNQQTIESTLHTSANVTGESDLYQQGTQLRDKTIYLLPATPNATLTVQTTVPPDEDVHLTQQLELVMQATNGGTVFWERSRTLQEQQVTTSDGSLNTSATLDIPKLKDQTDEIRSEIGAESSLHIFIRVTTSYETSLYSGSISETSSLRLAQDLYSFKPLTIGKTESTPETREVILPTRSVFSYLVPAGIGVGVLLLAVAIEFIFRRVRGQDILAEQVHRTRYSEWISAGTIPPSMGSKYVSVDSLEDLVGIAIDSRKRVLFDRSEDVYVVIDGPVVYYYGDWPRRKE
ncbi:DUF5305 family protein [Halobellus salinisoli]|uniref:DUF5305 family protein n=1 Tax=Halobellus salinisoli TaxID=3108500 RepID=UPI0030089C2E